MAMNRGDDELREVVAVFRTQAAAEHAAEAAASAGALAVSVDSRRGEVLALDAEMRDEMEHTVLGPGNIGPFTKESTKGLSLGVGLGLVIGAVIALPLAFIDYGVPLWQRVLIAVITGALAGSTVGFVVGGGVGARGPAQPLASEEGVPVVVQVSPEGSAAIEELLSGHDDLIRLDIAERGQPVRTVTEDEDESFAHEVGRKSVQAEGDWAVTRSEDRANEHRAADAGDGR